MQPSSIRKPKIWKKKSWEFRDQAFQTPVSQRRTDHHPWKIPLFIRDRFSCKWDNKISFKFYRKEGVLIVHRMMPSMLGFLVWFTNLGVDQNSRCFGPLCRVNSQMNHYKNVFLVSLDKNTLYLDPCVIWMMVVKVGFEEYGNSLQNWRLGKPKSLQKQKIVNLKCRPRQNGPIPEFEMRWLLFQEPVGLHYSRTQARFLTIV